MATSTGSTAKSITGSKGDANVQDSKELAKEFGTISLAAEIRTPVFCGRAEEDVLGWIARFDTVARALDWDV